MCVCLHVYAQESKHLVLCSVVVVIVQWFGLALVLLSLLLLLLLSGSTCLSFVCRFLCRFCGCFGACLVYLLLALSFACPPGVPASCCCKVRHRRIIIPFPFVVVALVFYLSLSNVRAALRLAAAQFFGGIVNNEDFKLCEISAIPVVTTTLSVCVCVCNCCCCFHDVGIMNLIRLRNTSHSCCQIAVVEQGGSRQLFLAMQIF